jgi:hypothetical protein
LPCLQQLSISLCRSLQELPASLGLCLGTGLQQLTITGCGALHALPEGLGQLEHLQVGYRQVYLVVLADICCTIW